LPSPRLKSDEYDVIFDITGIKTMDSKGWEVHLRSDGFGIFQPRANDGSGLSGRLKGSIVSVVGLYNKGKTLVVNRLSDSLLPSGTKVNTRGLSFLAPKCYEGSLIFLDTAGTHSPVQVHSEAALLDRRATELFIQDLVFDIADYFVVVIQDLTWPDQEYIQALVIKLGNSQKHFKQVIVVHNFRDVDNIEEALDNWKLQVIHSYPLGEQITRPVSLPDNKSVVATFYASKNVRHIFIAKEGSPAGNELNPPAFQLLKGWLYDIVVEAGKELRPMEKILESANLHLKNYIEEGCKNIKYCNSETGVISLELEDNNCADLKLRPFTLGWVSPNFETGEFVPPMDVWTGPEGWICTLDIPGVVQSTIKVVTRNWPVIKIEGERHQIQFDGFKLEHNERKFSPFCHTIKVNPALDPRSKAMEFRDGQLIVRFSLYNDLEDF